MPFPVVAQTIYGGWTQEGEQYADLKTRFSAYNTKLAGLACDSVTDDRAALNTLVNTTMQPNGGRLDIVGVVRTATNITIPSNVTVRFLDGALLAPDVGTTITINGRLHPVALRKIFGGGGVVAPNQRFAPAYYAEWWGATGDGVTDDTIAVLAVIAACAIGGGIWQMLPAIYRTTQTVYVPKWVQIIGVSYHGPSDTYDGISVILGSHTGAAVLSYKNSLGCRLENFTIITLAGAVPKTGIAMGRNLGLGSAGSHVIENVNVVGYFSAAGVYMVASEENQISNLSIDIQGGGALSGLFLSQGDNLAVDTFGASSNINNCFWNLRVASEVVDDNFNCISLFGGSSSGDIRFYGGYMIPARGSYVYINVGNQDAASMLRAISFYAIAGEMNIASTGPLYGFNLDGNGAYTMCVNVEGVTFKCRVGGNYLKMNPVIKLQDSRWKVPLPDRGSSYVLTQFVRCDIDLGAGRFFFGDHLMGDVSKFGFSASNTSGAYWGDPNVATSPQIRQQAGNNQLQLLSNGAFYDFALKDCWLGGIVPLKQGAGTPEGAVTAPVGSQYLRTNGGAATTLYIKESGTGNTGWIAK